MSFLVTSSWWCSSSKVPALILSLCVCLKSRFNSKIFQRCCAFCNSFLSKSSEKSVKFLLLMIDTALVVSLIYTSSRFFEKCEEISRNYQKFIVRQQETSISACVLTFGSKYITLRFFLGLRSMTQKNTCQRNVYLISLVLSEMNKVWWNAALHISCKNYGKIKSYHAKKSSMASIFTPKGN